MIENGYLLDTNIFSLLSRARGRDLDPRCQAVLAKAKSVEATAQLFICAVTVGEVEYGLQLSSPIKDAVVQAQVRADIASFPIIHSINQNVAARYYADIRARIFIKYGTLNAKNRIKQKWPEEMNCPTTAKSLGIQENDLWILAIAMTYNLILVTGDNMPHINAVLRDEDGVSIENWATV